HRQRVPLPTYPFERQRYWVDPDPIEFAKPVLKGALRKHHDITQWFYTSSWRRSITPQSTPRESDVTTMVIDDGSGLCTAFKAPLRVRGDRIIAMRLADNFRRVDDSTFEVAPSRSDDWIELIETLRSGENLPDRIVHMTALGPSRGRRLFGIDHDMMTAFDST